MGARGDLLPAALSFCGLAFCAGLREESRLPRIVPASALFALAFAAKATSVFGAGASVIWLLVNGRRRQALQLAFLTAAIAGALIGIAEWASDGRFLENIFACGSAGGNWRTALQAPLALLSNLYDTILMHFLLLAGIVLWISRRQCLREFPTIILAVTLLGSVMIFATPGTDRNHLLDLFVTLVVVAAAGVVFRHVSIALGGVVLAIICVSSVVDRTANEYSEDRVDRISIYRRAIEATARGEGPLLAGDAMFPLLAGERPVVLDVWMLGILMRNRPEIAADLRDRAARRAFRGAVLRIPKPNSAQVPGSAVKLGNIGTIFAGMLEPTYYQAELIDGYVVYLPRPSAADTGPRPRDAPQY